MEKDTARFDLKYDGKLKVVKYVYDSCEELIHHMQETPTHGGWSEIYDIFAYPEYHHADAITNRATYGTDKTEIVEKVAETLDDINVTESVTLEKFRQMSYRPAGCVPVIGRVMAGQANNMLVMDRKKESIVKFCIDSAGGAYYMNRYAVQIGSALARVSAMIENAGYKTKFTALSSTEYSSKNLALMMVTKIKDEGEPMDLARFMYPLLHVKEYEYALSFTWCNRIPESPSRGVRPKPLVSGDSGEKRAIYEWCTEENTIMLPLLELGEVLDRNGGNVQKLEEYILKLFIRDDEAEDWGEY